jgi:hypothetical protein
MHNLPQPSPKQKSTRQRLARITQAQKKWQDLTQDATTTPKGFAMKLVHHQTYVPPSLKGFVRPCLKEYKGQ